METQGTAIVVRRLKIALSGILISVSFVACQQRPTEQLPYYNTPDFTPIWSNETAVNIDTLHTIGAFQFTDQDGKPVNNETYASKIYVTNFFFTSCPGICPKMTDNISTVSKAFKDNSKVLFLSLSVTPETDSVSQLKLYADNHQINSTQWHLATGKKDEIYTLARKSFFAEKEPGFSKDSSDFLHSEHLLLIDAKGHIRGLYNGTLELEAERLQADISLLLKES